MTETGFLILDTQEQADKLARATGAGYIQPDLSISLEDIRLLVSGKILMIPPKNQEYGCSIEFVGKDDKVD